MCKKISEISSFVNYQQKTVSDTLEGDWIFSRLRADTINLAFLGRSEIASNLSMFAFSKKKLSFEQIFSAGKSCLIKL